MTSRYRNLLPLTLSVTAALICLGTARQARADLTVVTETTTHTDISGASPSDLGNGLADLGKPLTLSVSYVKGKVSRYDTEERVILRGLQEGTISVLNPATQTYYVTTESDEFARTNGGSAAAAEKAIGDAKLRAKTTVTDVKGRRSILGLSAHGITYNIGMAVNFPKDTPDVPDNIRVTVSGDTWSTNDLADTPGDVTTSHIPVSIPTPIAEAMRKISDKFRGNALSSTLVFHIDASDKGHAVRVRVVQRQDVRAISHAPLSDDVFRVPDGYTLVQAPSKSSTPADAKPASAGVSAKTTPTGA